MRKGTEIPYSMHLLAVCALALENGADEDEAIAALLHDAIEDGGGKRRHDDIAHRFGARVASVVAECSDTDETPKPPFHERKQAYIEHLAHASDSAIRVSLADKLHNARAILADYRVHGDELWGRFNAGADDQLWYYGSLVAAFEARLSSPHVAELDATVGALRELVAATRRGREY